MFKFLFYKFGEFIVRHLSIKGAYKFGTFFSFLQYYFSPRDRKAVRNNLISITGLSEDDPQIKVLTKDVFRNFGKYLVEFFRMASEMDEEFINKKIKIVNIEAAKKVQERGKGVIILSAHVGNWELGAVVLSMLGLSPYAIALPHKERPVNNLFNKQREDMGVGVISSNAAFRKSIRALRENKSICILGDRVFGTQGEILDFLGKECLMPRGTAILSARTGAGIVPTFMIREKDDTFTFILLDPIFPPDTSQGRESVEKDTIVAIMKKYIHSIEDIIRRYPSQWLMFRKYWLHD